jgi:heme exporter protein D
MTFVPVVVFVVDVVARRQGWLMDAVDRLRRRRLTGI